jgi:DNA-binding HxlR family transcriptional regulator
VLNQWASPHRFIVLLDGRWTLALLSEFTGGGRRYQGLHDPLHGIAHKVLTETLRQAERVSKAAKGDGSATWPL